MLADLFGQFTVFSVHCVLQRVVQLFSRLLPFVHWCSVYKSILKNKSILNNKIKSTSVRQFDLKGNPITRALVVTSALLKYKIYSRTK